MIPDTTAGANQLRLMETLAAAGLPVATVAGSGPFAVTYSTTLTSGQQTSAAAIIAAFDSSPAGQLAWDQAQARAAALALVPSLDEHATLLRASHLTVFGVLQNAFSTINALIAAVNALNGGSIPALPTMTWAQLVALAEQQIASGAADGTTGS